MITVPVWVVVLVAIVAIAALVGLWASGVASRLNRLHIRTDAARLSLEGALSARNAVLKALYPELSAQVSSAQLLPLKATDMGRRSDAENALLAALPDEACSQASFIEASARVDLAARFYNDAVADTRAVRMRKEVRALRLAGSAPLPEFYEGRAEGA